MKRLFIGILNINHYFKYYIMLLCYIINFYRILLDKIVMQWEKEFFYLLITRTK
jgi:hypothetical protein